MPDAGCQAQRQTFLGVVFLDLPDLNSAVVLMSRFMCSGTMLCLRNIIGETEGSKK